MFVYLIINDVNDKIYVGKTVTNNLQQYLQKKFWYAKSRPDLYSRLYRAIRKHGREHFHIHPLVTGCDSNEALCVWEITLIELFQTRNPEIGYNICKGGEGFSGPHGQSARDRISIAASAMWKRPEIRDNFSAKMAGHPVSSNVISALQRRKGSKATPETIQKLIDSHTGLTRSLESRNKQRQSVTGINNHFYGKKHSEDTLAKTRKPIHCIDTGDIFPSLLHAAQWAGWNGGGSGNLSRALKGKGNFLGKRFEYVQQLSEPIIGEIA